MKAIIQGYRDRAAFLAMQDHEWIGDGFASDLYFIGYRLPEISRILLLIFVIWGIFALAGGDDV